MRVENTDYFLHLPEFDSLTDAGEVYRLATLRLPILNALGSLRFDAHLVECDNSVIRVDDDGSRHVSVFLSAAFAVGRSRVFALGVVVDSQGQEVVAPVRDPWLEIVELVGQDAKVEDALYIFGAVGRNWVELYKVYEVVREDLGDAGAVKKVLKIADDQLGSFTNSANDRRISGRDARHAKSFSDSLKYPPMSFAEAERFIRDMLNAWLREKVKRRV